MPDFAIRSKGDPRFAIQLADCTREHADTVLASVAHPGFNGPHDLELHELVDVAARARRWWQLWRLRRG